MKYYIYRIATHKSGKVEKLCSKRWFDTSRKRAISTSIATAKDLIACQKRYPEIYPDPITAVEVIVKNYFCEEF